MDVRIDTLAADSWQITGHLEVIPDDTQWHPLVLFSPVPWPSRATCEGALLLKNLSIA
jgi:hypothetical protein